MTLDVLVVTGGLVALLRRRQCSPIVYVQPGDSAATFANEDYRRLLTNALAWVESPDARQWAAANPRPIRE